MTATAHKAHTLTPSDLQKECRTLHQRLAFTDPPESPTSSQFKTSVSEPLTVALMLPQAVAGYRFSSPYLKSIAAFTDVMVSNGLVFIDLSVNIQ